MLEGAYNRINDSRRDPMSSASIRSYIDNGYRANYALKNSNHYDSFESANKKKKIKIGVAAVAITGVAAFLGAMGLARKGVLKKFPKSFGEVSEIIRKKSKDGINSFFKKADEKREKPKEEGFMDLLKKEYKKEVSDLKQKRKNKKVSKKQEKALKKEANKIKKEEKRANRNSGEKRGWFRRNKD